MVKLGDLIQQDTIKMAQEAMMPLGGEMLNKQSAFSSVGPINSQFRGSVPPIGPEIQIANEWIRSQIYNRIYLIQNMYSLATMSAEVRSAIKILRNEVFRRGIFHWNPKFESKCPGCEDEFQVRMPSCPKCHIDTVGPDKEQIKKLTDLSSRVNSFGQSLEEVLRMTMDDINIADDAFLLINNDYEIVDGKLYAKPLEVWRLNPALVAFDLDKNGYPKNNRWVCPLHRDDPEEEPGVCPEDGVELKPAMYIYTHRASQHIALLEDEVIHFSYYSPSPTYGFSPLLSIFEKVLTLIGMDRFVYRYFFERKMPAAMLVTSTDDPDTIRREREYILARLRQDPDYLPWVATSARTGRGRTDLVRLFHTLQEMDYLPVRQEIRQRVSAMYEVTDTWMNAPSSGGGLSSSTQQLVVTSRAVESHQRLYNDKLFPLLLKAFGITDWALHLPQPEEKAEATRLQFTQQRVSAANMLHNMGLTVEVVGGESNIDEVQFRVSGATRSEEGSGAVTPGAEQGGDLASLLSPPDTSEEKSMGGSMNGTVDELIETAEGEKERMHQHDGLPPHLAHQPHNTMGGRKRQEERVFTPSDWENDLQHKE